MRNVVRFSRSVMSDSLWPHEPQHTRPPCPSPTPRVHPNPCPLSSWCHPTISSSVVPFFSYTQSFPASGSFQMSQLFASSGQSIGASASTSVLPMIFYRSSLERPVTFMYGNWVTWQSQYRRSIPMSQLFAWGGQSTGVGECTHPVDRPWDQVGMSSSLSFTTS